MAWKAKFMVKGTAVTAIMMLLILPSSFVFRSSFATVYPEEAAPVGLSPPTLTTVTSHPPREPRVGDQFIILTSATNREEFDRPFVVITEVFDSEGVAESIGIVSGVIPMSNSTKVGVSWTPLHAGIYHLKSFAISELEKPMILANPSQSTVTVV